MGSSGAGKTTLIRILLGLIRPDAGHITGLSGLTPSVVFQENRLFPGLTALENAEAAGVKGGSGRYWLKRLGLGDALDLRPQALSGGMQRRVANCQGPFATGEISSSWTSRSKGWISTPGLASSPSSGR